MPAVTIPRLLSAATDPAIDPNADTATDAATPTPTPTSTATSSVEQATEAVTEATLDLLTVLWHAGLGAAAGLAVALVVVVVLGQAGKHRALWAEVVRFARLPLYVFAALTGGFIGVQVAIAETSMSVLQQYALQMLLIGVILSGTWVITGLVKAVESSIVIGVNAKDDLGRANRVTTQAQIMRRVASAIVIVCGLVGAVMTFPSARLAMGSLLASAGLVSVIAGLAAQSTLGNVFAGIQLATTDAIRVDDVVVVDGEQGSIEEITLTYVVVRAWDDRRIIYPSSYFTENPFANWSRRGTEHTGTINLDLDWRVPVDKVREEVRRIVESSSAWDGRTAKVDVTNAIGGAVTLRIAVSGANPADVFALSCQVREELVAWLLREVPGALPHTRVQFDGDGVRPSPVPAA